jgi:transcriptional regulator with XRE-family HTH domain
MQGPVYRYALKGKIHAAGYRTMAEFGARIGLNLTQISRIVNGWELPTPSLQRKLASGLGISIREVKDLL